VVRDIAFVISGAWLAVAFGLLVVAPLFWIGFAWGLDSVRRPQVGWQRRMRWSWVAALGLASGTTLAPLLFVAITASSEVDPAAFVASSLKEIAVSLGTPLLGCAVLPALVLGILTRIVARGTGNWCLRCGYDLRACEGDVCPECGLDRPAVRGSPTRQAARKKAMSHAIRGVVWLAGLLALAGVGVGIYDCTVPTPTYGALRCCEKCGAIDCERTSPRWSLPLPAARLCSFQSSATCEHQWVNQFRFQNGVCSTKLADLVDGGAILMEIVTDPSNPSKKTYMSLELPSDPLAQPQAFMVRWRQGAGSLDAEDAKSAVIEVHTVDLSYYPSIMPLADPIKNCTPPELASEVRSLLRSSLTTPGRAQPVAPKLTFIGDSNGGVAREIHRQSPNERLWSTFRVLNPAGTGTGAMTCTLWRDPRPGVRVGVASAEQWKTVKTEAAPWKSVTLTKDVWDKFGAAVPNPAMTANP
jgi:hypothetical protein